MLQSSTKFKYLAKFLLLLSLLQDRLTTFCKEILQMTNENTIFLVAIIVPNKHVLRALTSVSCYV